MAVYVDKAQNRFGRMVMCHMLADTVDELHEMAAKIGMRREWFQPFSSPHYDLSKAMRAKAVQHGAIEINNRQVAELIKKRRAEWIAQLAVNPRRINRR